MVWRSKLQKDPLSGLPHVLSILDNRSYTCTVFYVQLIFDAGETCCRRNHKLDLLHYLSYDAPEKKQMERGGGGRPAQGRGTLRGPLNRFWLSSRLVH
ncbi:hypothetical protein XENTR_v10020284 [Xenopus tropicalis]|nr:hypothetical protein XENTR_v10020284 [Xenopus tropicalis]